MLTDLNNIKGFYDKYHITKCGNIILKKNGKKISQNIGKNNRKTALVSGKTRNVARIIALYFLGPSSLEVNHIDGNKQNNHISNLEFVTKSENMIHAYKTGLRKKECTMKNRIGIARSRYKHKFDLYDKDNSFIKSFVSLSDISRYLKTSQTKVLRNFYDNKRYNLYGYNVKKSNELK